MDNATNKNITWKSSDESIAIINATGQIVAQKSGIVNITASSYNGKTSTIKINVKEEPKVELKADENQKENTTLQKTEKNDVIQTSTSNTNNMGNKNVINSKEESNSVAGLIGLGVLGGGSYWGYKKYKGKK